MRDVVVLLELRGDRRLDVGGVGALDVDLLGLVEGLRDALAPPFEPDVALLLDDAEGLAGLLLGEPLARGLAGELVVLAEEGERAHVLPVLHAGVEGDDGDVPVDGLLDVALHRLGLGEGDRDAVDLLVHRLLHEVGLLGALGVGGVLELDVVLLRRVLGTGTDLVPEGVAGLGVGDEGDGHLGGVDAPGAATSATARLLLAA